MLDTLSKEMAGQMVIDVGEKIEVRLSGDQGTESGEVTAKSVKPKWKIQKLEIGGRGATERDCFAAAAMTIPQITSNKTIDR